MLSWVQVSLFDYLIAVHLWWLRIALLFIVECCSSAWAFYFLFDYEIGLMKAVLALQRVLTNVFQNFLSIVLLFLPFWDVVARLLILKSLQYQLILLCYFWEFPFPRLSVERSAATSHCLCWHKWLNRHFGSGLAHHIRPLLAGSGADSAHSLCRVSSIESASLFLEDISHFLKENSVFSLDFSVPL